MRRCKIGQIVALAMTLAPLEAMAQSTTEVEALLGQSIVSTPTKTAETDVTAPATSMVISAEDLRRYGIRSLDEAINYLSLGMTTTNPLHAVEIGARGVLLTADYGNHVLLLVDGHVMNEPWDGTAYFERGAGIPFEMIDHIEVTLGPGSVMYGSQAMLGIIHIVTKRAKDFSGVRMVGEVDTTLPSRRDGSIITPSTDSGYLEDLGMGYRVGAGYGKEFNLGRTPAELTLGLEYFTEDGPTWEFGPQNFGDDPVTGQPKNFGPKNPTPGVWGGRVKDGEFTRVPSAYTRFRAGNFQAAARAAIYTRGTPYLDNIVQDSADFDDTFNHEVDRWLNLDLSYNVPISSRTEFLVRTYGDVYDYRWHNRTTAPDDCPENFATGCERLLVGVAHTMGGELRGQLHWGDVRATTMFGVDAKLMSTDTDFDIDEMAGPARLSTENGSSSSLIAPYVAQSFAPTAWMDLNLGLRLDYDSKYDPKLSPRTAVGFTPWTGGRFKIIYSEAFRGPTPYELGYSDPNNVVAARELDPEIVRSLEASIQQQLGGHRILFGVFRSWWSGLVNYRSLDQGAIDAAILDGDLAPGTTAAYRYANMSGIDNYGLNAAYDGLALDERLQFGLNMTAAYTGFEPGDGAPEAPISVSPQVFGNAHASYDFGIKFPTLGLALSYIERRPADRAFDGGFSEPPFAPAHVSLRGTLSGDVPALTGLSYRLGVDYSFAKNGPYVIGPNMYAADATQKAELSPTKRLQAFLGLEYHFEP